MVTTYCIMVKFGKIYEILTALLERIDKRRWSWRSCRGDYFTSVIHTMGELGSWGQQGRSSNRTTDLDAHRHLLTTCLYVSTYFIVRSIRTPFLTHFLHYPEALLHPPTNIKLKCLKQRIISFLCNFLFR